MTIIGNITLFICVKYAHNKCVAAVQIVKIYWLNKYTCSIEETIFRKYLRKVLKTVRTLSQQSPISKGLIICLCCACDPRDNEVCFLSYSTKIFLLFNSHMTKNDLGQQGLKIKDS